MKYLHINRGPDQCENVGFLTPQSLRFVFSTPEWRRHHSAVSSTNLNCLKTVHHHESRVNRHIIYATTKLFDIDRRRFSASIISSATIWAVETICPRGAHALSSPFAQREDLSLRLGRQAPGRPGANIFSDDLFYPNYFAGVWKSKSTLKSVASPAGYKLFGRMGSYEAAVESIGSTLLYTTRFITSPRGVISDRSHNVRSIAEASLGNTSVLFCAEQNGGPNALAMSVRPSDAEGSVYDIKLKVISRQQDEAPMPNVLGRAVCPDGSDVYHVNERDTVSSAKNTRALYTTESVRQTIRLSTDDLRVSPIVKDVETTSVFVLDPQEVDTIVAWQRTCTYLVKSDARYVDARGRPVDVRWYELQYYRR